MWTVFCDAPVRNRGEAVWCRLTPHPGRGLEALQAVTLVPGVQQRWKRPIYEVIHIFGIHITHVANVR
jgi:hypothetical protein